MLIDSARIFVRSGKGGDGCLSFRREKYVPKGGPDGGDGGKGGDVVLVVDPSLTTLLPLTPRPHYRAKNGEQGRGSSCFGANGADCVVPVPPGTIVLDEETGERLVDLVEPGERWVAARGGRGGIGNEHFKSATNQTPRETTPGEPWEERTLRLELKLIADVGFVGKPNAGKSTLLGAITRARPKVADYPFTTLGPHLGFAELPGDRRLLLADLPGLIKGAARGAGLGHDFLRHVERTRVLAHVIDVLPLDGSDPLENHAAIRAELEAYSDELARKPELVVVSKLDLLDPETREQRVAEIAAALGLQVGVGLVAVCAATGEGLREMLEAAWRVAGGGEEAGWSGATQSS